MTDQRNKNNNIENFSNDKADPDRLEELYLENKILNTILEGLTHPFYLIDVDSYKVLKGNSASGLQGDEDITCYELTHKRSSPCEGKEHPCPVEIIKKTNKPTKVEHIHYDINGDPIDVEVHGYPIFDENGKLKQVIEYSLDISLRKKIERKLREKEQAIKSSIDAMALAELDGRITYVNDSFLKLWGFSNKEEAYNTLIQELWEEGESGDQVLTTLFETGSWVGELNSVRIDNKPMVLHLSTSLVYNEENQPVKIIASFMDITQRKINERSIEARIDLMNFAAENPLEVVLQKILDEISFISDSEIGFFHFVVEDESKILTKAWSSNTLKNFCKIEEDKGETMVKVEECGIWVEPLFRREPVIHNDYSTQPHRKGLPEGHPEIKRQLIVPIFREDSIVALMGIGDRNYPYTQDDIQIAAYFADVAWEIIEQKQAEEKIAEYTMDLELKNIEIENLYRQLDEEMVRARKIHERTFLPDHDELNEARELSMATHFYPAKELGGDFYNFIKMDDKLIIYLSDVSGHGLDGTIISVFVKETIESYVSLKPEEITPDKILQHINRQYRRDNYPEDYFVCIFVAVLDLKEYKLSYSGAGMQFAPLVVLGDKRQIELPIKGLPISSAIPSQLMNFETKNLGLIPPSTILFYTDGIAEQDNGGKIYEDRLKQVFYSHSHHTVKAIKRGITEDFMKFNQGSLQGDDDITFIVLKFHPRHNL